MLNAGVVEEGKLMHSETGTPQGGVVSPILANVFLHEVLDVWFHVEVLPRLGGAATLVRYADDFVIVFKQENDARRVMDVLPMRFGKYGLTLHPTKTKLVSFQKPPPGPPKGGSAGEGPGAFDLLGFTHYWTRSRSGYWVVMLKTAKNRLTRAAKRFGEWCQKNRHLPVKEQSLVLNWKLKGHDSYYGIVGNAAALWGLRYELYRRWQHWLDRRSQRARVTWERMKAIHDRYPLVRPPPATKLRHLRA